MKRAVRRKGKGVGDAIIFQLAIIIIKIKRKESLKYIFLSLSYQDK